MNIYQSPNASIVNIYIRYKKCYLQTETLDCSCMRLIDTLRLKYKEMRPDEYDCEVNKKLKKCDKRWDRCGISLRITFA